MSFWRFLSLTSLVFALSISAVAAAEMEGLAEISDRLSKPPVTRASFTQKRHVEALTRPLLTEGKMVFAESQGLAWLVEAPFQTNLSLTRSHVTEWNDETARQRTPLSTRPALSALVTILMPILSADFEGLAENFVVKETVSENSWEIVLTPRSTAMFNVISSIEISGDSVVRELVVREAKGDWTQLLFTNYLSDATPLSAKELRYFQE